MNSLIVSGLFFVVVVAGAALGMLMRSALPDHHTSDASRDAILRAVGFVVTLAALVLGFLVSSAKTYYDSVSEDLRQIGADMGSLDRALQRYGPAASPARQRLRIAAGDAVHVLWPDTSSALPNDGRSALLALEDTDDAVRSLPADDARQARLKDAATGYIAGIERKGMLLGELVESHMQTPLLVIVVSWLVVIYGGFGLATPRTGAALVALALSALACSGAVFVILELYSPLDGLVRVDPSVFEDALALSSGDALSMH